FAEGVDALSGIAHQVGELAAPAKEQQGHDGQNENVPDAERAHETLPRLRLLYRTPVPCVGLKRGTFANARKLRANITSPSWGGRQIRAERRIFRVGGSGKHTPPHPKSFAFRPPHKGEVIYPIKISPLRSRSAAKTPKRFCTGSPAMRSR